VTGGDQIRDPFDRDRDRGSLVVGPSGAVG
jgi:hypothetical protein